MSTTVAETSDVKKKSFVRRFLPLAVLLGLAIAFFALGLDQYMSFEALREHRTFLTEFVSENLILAILIYMVVYSFLVAASLPAGSVFTITGGFLFGSILGTAVTVMAATIGATLIFLIAKGALGDSMREKAGGTMEKILDGFREDAFSYLLVLRLVPLFPFFVVNIAPAFAGVSVKTYTIATFFGIIPGTFVFSQVGTGLGSIFDAGEEFTASNILTTEIVIALVGLAVLSLIPVVYKRFKKS